MPLRRGSSDLPPKNESNSYIRTKGGKSRAKRDLHQNK